MLLLVASGTMQLRAQNNAIFNGGDGDGYGRDSVLQAMTNIWRGGEGDGYARDSVLQAGTNIWRGGEADGYARDSVLEAMTNLWKGGEGDGYSRDSLLQASTNIWRGGEGDGYNRDSLLQAANNIWQGGSGDGWGTFFTGNTTLPVQLLSFEARAQAASALLQWISTQELGLDRYELQRSADGRSFERIYQRKAVGITTGEQLYVYEDAKPLTGSNYYRLRLVDADGTVRYSPVKHLFFGQAVQVKLYPNPATHFVQLQMLSGIQSSAGITVNVTNAAGMLVMQHRTNAGQLQSGLRIPVNTLAKGLYRVQLIGTDTQLTASFIVQ